MRKCVLRNFANFTGKHLCQSLFFNKVAGRKKETLAQVFSCEFCEISKNTFFTEQHLFHRTRLGDCFFIYPLAVHERCNIAFSLYLFLGFYIIILQWLSRLYKLYHIFCFRFVVQDLHICDWYICVYLLIF